MPRSPFHHHGADRWDGEEVPSGIRFYHGVDFDLQSSDAPPLRDDQLREWVDALPADERHMVARVHFAGETLTCASGEIGVSRSTGARILREALERLREWVEGGVPEPMSAAPVPALLPAVDVSDCTFEHPDWGRCRQEEKAHGLCGAHLFWLRTGVTPEPGYHRKVIEGGRSVHQFLSESEMEALVNGRYRGDGRRLDAYVTHDPLGFMPWVGGEVE